MGEPKHAPEIDPFIANRVSIIKGAASVRYGSDAISGVILVEPSILAPAKALEGEVNLVAGTDGQMGAGSALFRERLRICGDINWRVQGSLKKAGNFRTPDYYLANTGFQETDFSLTAELTITKRAILGWMLITANIIINWVDCRIPCR